MGKLFSYTTIIFFDAQKCGTYGMSLFLCLIHVFLLHQLIIYSYYVVFFFCLFVCLNTRDHGFVKQVFWGKSHQKLLNN